MEKAYQLPQALGRVGRVEEPVQLRHRGAEATRKLASAESGPLRTPPRLHGQLVNQELRAGLFAISVSSSGTATKRGAGPGLPSIRRPREPRAPEGMPSEPACAASSRLRLSCA